MACPVSDLTPRWLITRVRLIVAVLLLLSAILAAASVGQPLIEAPRHTLDDDDMLALRGAFGEFQLAPRAALCGETVYIGRAVSVVGLG